MTVKLKSFTAKITDFLKNNKKNSLLLIVGIVGIIVIGLSDIVFAPNSNNKSDNNQNISTSEYIEILENKTVKILSGVEGAGRVRVMITAEGTSEQQFAVNEDNSTDIQGDSENINQKLQSQTEIVIVEGDSGKDEALVTKITEPQIRGVLVLCEGADNIKTSEEITLAVKTVLGISANKICVLKLK